MALNIVIMAAGKGTRMKSSRPKPLHLICGRAMVLHVIQALELVHPERTVVVTTAEPSARERFLAIPAVESVTGEGPQFTVRGRGDELVTQVIQCLGEHRMTVIDFRTVVPTLEDVFLKLTGHLIRD